MIMIGEQIKIWTETVMTYFMALKKLNYLILRPSNCPVRDEASNLELRV
jgi:hypothetical protein